MSATHCVYGTAVDASILNYKPIVLADCTTAMTVETKPGAVANHATLHFLRNIQGLYGDVRTSEEFLGMVDEARRARTRTPPSRWSLPSKSDCGVPGSPLTRGPSIRTHQRDERGRGTMDDYIDELKRVDTSTLANLIELLKVRDRTEGSATEGAYGSAACSRSWGRWWAMPSPRRSTARPPGPAPAADASARLFELFEAVEAAPQPSVMVFQEVGAEPARGCHCGEVMATIGKRLGCVGVVSDAGVRDVEEVLGLGLHYFAAGCVASHGELLHQGHQRPGRGRGSTDPPRRPAAR